MSLSLRSAGTRKNKRPFTSPTIPMDTVAKDLAGSFRNEGIFDAGKKYLSGIFTSTVQLSICENAPAAQPLDEVSRLRDEQIARADREMAGFLVNTSPLLM